ncbi:MAG TPA: hypothetical protein VKY26_06220, partial [Actinomycetota bacterium]|nr:hypothetical protein [Actinomycetota bacterium]
AELPGTESPGDEPAFQLGALATAWPAVQRAGSAVQVREALRASAWGDPGDGGVAELGAALRLAWSGRLAEGLPPARRWATAAAAVVVARERFAHRRNLTPPALADARRLIGRAWEPAPTVALFAAALAPDCRWPLEGVGDSTDLWQAESKWWRTVDREAERLSARAGTGEEAVAAAGMLLLADAWRAGAALEAAGWGAAGVEVFDAVA